MDEHLTAMRGAFFYCVVIGFVLGVAGASILTLSFDVVYILSVFSTVLALAGLIFFKKKTIFLERNLYSSAFLTALFIFSFALGIVRTNFANLHNGDPILNRVVGAAVKLGGTVSEEPDVREYHIQYVVTLKNIYEGDLEMAVKSKVLVILPSYPKYNYGDTLILGGVLKKPENFDGNNGRQFNYISFLAKDGIYYEMQRPKVTLSSSGNGNFIKSKLLALKGAFIARISRAIPFPESALLAGLLVGTKQSLGKSLLADFTTAGVVQVIVISGYNVTIVASSIMKALSFLPSALSSSLGVISIILFAILTGAGSTVIRASIMALVAIFGKSIGREYNISRALFLAAMVMLIFNPRILLFDPGFQFSFLATLGLVVVTPILKPKFFFITEKFNLREIVVSTVAAQIFVLPLLLYMMGLLSVVALFTNILILGFIPLTMFLGFCAGVFGFINYFLSVPFAFLAFVLLSYEIQIVEFFAHLPAAALTLPTFPFWVVIFVYVLYACGLWWLHNREGLRSI